MKIDTTTIYYFLEKFYQFYQQELKKHCLPSSKKVTREPSLTMAEILAILLMYNFSPCKNFKFYYLTCVNKNDFPTKVSYQRFIALIPRTFPILCLLIKNLCQDRKEGIYFIDSTSLAVCHPKRISRNKVFAGLAELGKSSKGWFFGFKLHLIIDAKGYPVDLCITRGNSDDRSVVEDLTVEVIGKLYADKGYISAELFKKLFARGLHLVTGIKKNMKNILTPLMDKTCLRKRSIIETVFDYLKNKFDLEHTRHRSACNAFVHMLSVLIAYALKPNKPSIKFNFMLPN
jgi:hypothetical protein